MDVIDEVLTVSSEQAFETARRAAKEEGLLGRYFRQEPTSSPRDAACGAS